MTTEEYSALINYYDYLNVPQDAPLADLRKAFADLVTNTQARLNNPLTMESALFIHNVVVPGIQRDLISDPETRSSYNQRLLAYQEKQLHHNQLLDTEGLDDQLPRPFFFDPFNGFDTEEPAFTLRQIAQKMDREWEQASQWIIDTSNEHHTFVGFLNFVAGRPQLGERIEKIIKAVSPIQKNPMPVNEGIERCITILNPQVERPIIQIYSPQFDGRVFEAGEFVPDQPAECELILDHVGSRGCVFGTVESLTDYVRFHSNRSSARFTLLPEHTEASLGISEVKIPFSLQLDQLQRNNDYSAHLVVRLENHETPLEIPIQIHFTVLPLPPRVTFTPLASQNQPLRLKPVRQGEQVRVTVTTHNKGDEHLIPLVGRITAHEQGTSAIPGRFHANEPITLTIDTKSRPKGQAYNVSFNVDYGLTPLAIGPTTLYLYGEILPTPWQSFFREKRLGTRLQGGLVGGLMGGALGLIAGSFLSVYHGNLLLYLFTFLLLSAILLSITMIIAQTITAHRYRSGSISANVRINPLVLWLIPIGIALVLTFICSLISNIGVATISGSTGGLVIGFSSGFIIDQAKAPSKKVLKDTQPKEIQPKGMQ